jgi:hypothetical protein
MTDEQMRIAIAEACGFGGEFSKRWILEVGMEGEDKFAFAATRNNLDEEVPAYPNDLNAMHEAEETLTANQRLHYANRVALIADQGWGFKALHANARQRAEAFLRTLNLWKE